MTTQAAQDKAVLDLSIVELSLTLRTAAILRDRGIERIGHPVKRAISGPTGSVWTEKDNRG